MSDDNS